MWTKVSAQPAIHNPNTKPLGPCQAAFGVPTTTPTAALPIQNIVGAPGKFFASTHIFLAPISVSGSNFFGRQSAVHFTTPTANQFALLTEVGDKDDAPNSTPSSAHRQLVLPVLDHATGQMLKHRQLCKHPAYKETWDRSYADKLGQLCQGIGIKPPDPLLKPSIRAPSQQSSCPTAIPTSVLPKHQHVAGTNSMRPIMFHKIRPERLSDVAHTHVFCKVRPTKEDPNRTCITIGGNTIAYLGNTGTKTGLLEVVKGIFNSVSSRQNTKFLTADISNYYLDTPLDCPEYVRI